MATHVLVIEDNHAYETILRRTIKTLDPEADIAWEESAEEAMLTLERDHAAGKEYDLIIADIFLAGKSTGIELWEACHERFPKTPVLITSGIPVDRFFEAIGRNTVAPPFLAKPFYIGECQQILRSLLAPG